jgi:cation diffusion facilitator family transporter
MTAPLASDETALEHEHSHPHPDEHGHDHAHGDADAEGHAHEHPHPHHDTVAHADDHAHPHGVDHPHEPDHDHPHDHDHDHPEGLIAIWSEAVRHLVRPHSHDHADSFDSALEADARGIRALKLSLLGLGATAVVQLALTVMTGSVALLADSLHNVADALTAIPIWIAFVLARRAASARFAYGYGRAEDLAGLIVLLFIAVSAGVAAIESISRLASPTEVRYLPVVAAAGIVGFLGNELVAQYRMRVGRRIGSAALVADGMHARTDGLTSLGVVAGAIGVAAGFPAADPIAGLIISAMILVVLKDAARQVLERMLDGADPALTQKIRDVLCFVPGIEGVGAVRARWMGHRVRVEAEVTVDRRRTLGEAHDIVESGRHALFHNVPHLDDAFLHADPCEHDGSDPHARVAHHAPNGTSVS